MLPRAWIIGPLLLAVLSCAGRRVTTTPPEPSQAVDATTLDRKLIMGYQGWHFCPGDGSPGERGNQWYRWFKNQKPGPDTLRVDAWPDVSELGPDELCTTPFQLPDGRPAMVYSDYRERTVLRHFEWMRANGLDGVALQRFTRRAQDKDANMVLPEEPVPHASRPTLDQVARHVRAAAEKTGRVFFIMYDISRHNPTTFVQTLESDWAYMVDTLKITESPRYLRHKGRPLVCIWGFGVADRPGTPEQAREVIAYFKSHPDPRYRVTLMGGVDHPWRTDAKWADVYRSFDVISPWTPGRYHNEAEADAFAKTYVIPDVEETKARGIDYMPVVFPGFSWFNSTRNADPELAKLRKKTAPLNAIPRQGGCFYWRQAFNVVSAGARMIYVAMFDEVDEGTAMYKMAPTRAELPVGVPMVPLDIDGYSLPSDWYLRVAGESAKMLRGAIPLSPQMRIKPEGSAPACCR